MEFFHAEIYWSGHGRVITNVSEIPNSDTGVRKRIQGSALLEIFLNDIEVNALTDYLERQLERKCGKDDVEKYMESKFYVGTPVDSWFDIEKFTRICAQLEIDPKMRFYSLIDLT